MAAIPKYAYLATRIAIRRARLLSDRAIDGLITQPNHPGLDDRLSLTRQHPDLDATGIEHALLQTLLADLAIILRPLTGTARDFFIFWAGRFELSNLKTMIRGKLKGLSTSEIAGHLQEVPGFATLAHEKLLNTESVAELLRRIESGPCSEIARQARTTLDERQDSLAVEAAIDQRYYAGLIDRAQVLPDRDRQALYALLGLQIDRINLSWLVRYRFAYGLPPSQTYYYLLRHGLYLNRATLLRLTQLAHCDAVIQALPGILRDRLQGTCDPLALEQRLDDLVLDSARKAVEHETSTLAKALGYLLLREHELRQLCAVIQGRRLGLDPKLIQLATANTAEEPA